MEVKKTYPKILLLIFSSSIFFIILYYILFYYTKQVENQVYTNSKAQFTNEVTKLVVLDSKPISVAINNDSNWDEYVNFITSKDTIWYNESIANEIEIYNVDYLGTYDANQNFVIHTATSKIKTIDFISKQAILDLNKSGLSKFYMKIPEGIIEVSGAAIHPSDDSKKNKTKAFGYFFVVRLLDANFLKNLEKLTNSRIQFIDSNAKNSTGKHHIYSTFDLKDNNNKVIAKLLFERKFDVYFENTIDILYIIMVAFIINLLINVFYTRKLVYHPLELVATVLETGSKKAIKHLKSTSGEFSYIGNLFEENNIQKLELVKAKLKAEESDRLKSSFLANLSHEIRTPMNAINGFTDLLLHTNLTDAERLEYLNVIDKSGRNLVSIIDDLIEMSKIDSNQITPNYTSINLESCINELFETIKVTIPKSKAIDFFIIENKNPAAYTIIVDEIKLKQIIINLVTNAIKFTNTGYVSFGYEINKKNNEIVFVIQDSGLGIDEINQKHIFERFKRVDGDASINEGGLGLGLAISKAYVEMMGGKIFLKSKVNKGSVFSFSIPLKLDNAQMISVQPIKVKDNFISKENGVILIAEDDNINFLLFQKIMQSKNYTIIRAINGQEAVDFCLSNSSVDLVLMDIKMPKMNGFEALEIIKAIRPELIVIAQTAYASVEDEEKILKAGFHGYLTKPINREKLFEVIENVFRNKK
ncbi:ATP-binding protein [Flavobacterium sp.]|uniref:ATP-binding protein n=1 Tax=Flavobacterium sp. TaxID=239 RepID=UPI00286BE1D1|nr:ATP-binding protein [Flavobacterium sp.]